MILTVVMGTAGPAWGQGMLGGMDRPMSAREMGELLEPLHLSPQQRQAVDEMHTAYLGAFEEFRRGPMEKFKTETAAALRGIRAVFDRAAGQRAVREWEGIRVRIRTLEEGLFDQMLGVLSEGQSERLPRVREARERRRLMGGLARIARGGDPASRIDLSADMMMQKFSPAVREAIDPVLAAYESRLTGLCRVVQRSSSTMILKIIKELDRRGFGAEAANDPGKRREMMGALQEVWNEVNRELYKDMGEISGLNRRTVEELVQMLEAKEGRELRTRYYRRAYPLTAKNSLKAGRRLTELGKRDDLGEELPGQILAVGDGHFATDDSLVRQMADLIDQRRLVRNATGRGQARDPASIEAQEQLEELQARRQKQDDSTMLMLNSLLGVVGEEVKVVKKVKGGAVLRGAIVNIELAKVSGRGKSVGLSLAPVAGKKIEKEAVLDSSGLPGPISRLAIGAFSDREHLDEANRAVLLSLFDAYREGFAEFLAGGGSILDHAMVQETMQTPDATTGKISPPDKRALDRLQMLRSVAMEEIWAEDELLYDDIELLLGEAIAEHGVTRFRWRREREVYYRQLKMGMGKSASSRAGSGSWELWLDLSQLVEGLDLSDLASEQQGNLNDTLVHYEEELTGYLKTAAAVGDRLRIAMAGRGNRQLRSGRDGEDGALQKIQRAQAEMRQTMTELNQSTRDTLQGILPEVAAEALGRAYDRKAFPVVFKDAGALEIRLGRALKLDDLSSRQRSGLVDLAAGYRSVYDGLCRELIEHTITNSAAVEADYRRRNWRAIRERREVENAIKFRRDDLNVKTRNRLRSILSEEQMVRIGEMPGK